MEKPDVDFIEGLSPAISIDQKSTSRNPRSTVGTITEIYDYLRVLYARVGHPALPEVRPPRSAARRPTRSSTRSWSSRRARGSRCSRRSCAAGRASTRSSSQTWRSKGFARARVDGEVRDLTEKIRLDRYFKHDIEVDRGPAGGQARHPPARRRLGGDRAAARRGHGLAGRPDRRRRGGRDVQPEARLPVRRHLVRRARRRATSRSTRRTARARPATASAPGSRSTRSWSCPTRTSRSPRARSAPWAGARPSTGPGCWRPWPRPHGFSIDTPWEQLSKAARETILYGTDGADPRELPEPVRAAALLHDDVRGRHHRPSSAATPRPSRTASARPARAVHARGRRAASCKGARLKPETLAVTVGGLQHLRADAPVDPRGRSRSSTSSSSPSAST